MTRQEFPQTKVCRFSPERSKRIITFTSPMLTTMNKIPQINQLIQAVLRIKKQDSVTAIEAAKWLDVIQLLKDSDSRPGLLLRNLLRSGQIRGQRQESNKEYRNH